MRFNVSNLVLFFVTISSKFVVHYIKIYFSLASWFNLKIVKKKMLTKNQKKLDSLFFGTPYNNFSSKTKKNCDT
jgi:hypothetical protein